MQGQTVLPNVDKVSILARTETVLTLNWNIAGGNRSYSYTLAREGVLEQINVTELGDVVTHEVPSLSPGTKYSFTLYTVFGEDRSTGHNFSAVTGK